MPEVEVKVKVDWLDLAPAIVKVDTPLTPGVSPSSLLELYGYKPILKVPVLPLGMSTVIVFKFDPAFVILIAVEIYQPVADELFPGPQLSPHFQAVVEFSVFFVATS